MRVEVNGTRLWFDVDGPALVPDGASMCARPTVIVVHGGPASYDHSYLKPWFGDMTRYAQVVYLDLRDHGRSARNDPEAWSFEQCADDIRGFCDTLGIERPVVVGHSLGGMIVGLYGARHPGHAAGLILLSTMGRFDLDRLTQGFRALAGEEVAALARRDYSVDDLTDAESTRVYAAFGPHVPTDAELARRVQNPALSAHGADLLVTFDGSAQLPAVTSPTLICVGDLDPVTPVSASEELLRLLPRGVGRLEIVAGTGHFPWLDRPEALWPVLERFVLEGAGEAQTAAVTPP
jgi:pimeloyl-ACP methyl ester carboxylesterase